APHIARVTLSGFISGDQPTLTMLDDIAKSKTASAVIVAVDSPGGTAPGSEAVHDALRRVAATKPVVAVVRNIAASGGYIAAVGADRIYARQTSFVGSIGVIIQYPDASRLLNTLGVKVEEVKSTPLKAEPTPFKPTSDEARKALEALIADSYAWFKNLVKQRRGYDDAALTQVADGRVFTGRQALDNKLIDALGDEKTAVEWLAVNRGINKDLAIRDWQPRRPSSWSLLRVSASAAQAFGWDRLARLLAGADVEGEALNAAGVLAVWRPPVE
ncbi:MAG: signal peptide peptidase SppA, partial [Beijerinckiaceae bacterium]